MCLNINTVENHVFTIFTLAYACICIVCMHYFDIPLIGKDGDDVIDNITCELTGTESINTRT